MPDNLFVMFTAAAVDRLRVGAIEGTHSEIVAWFNEYGATFADVESIEEATC